MSTSTQGEHTFDTDILISGEELRGYTASEDLTRGEPVTLTGNFEVGSSTDGGAFLGVALYDVTSGEEIAIGGDDCEVRLEVSEAITANDALVPDGVGGFRQAVDADREAGNAIAQEDITSGEFGEAYIFAVTGVTA